MNLGRPSSRTLFGSTCLSSDLDPSFSSLVLNTIEGGYCFSLGCGFLRLHLREPMPSFLGCFSP